MKNLSLIILAFMTFFVKGQNQNCLQISTTVSGPDPAFVQHFTKQVDVLGVSIYANDNVSDAKLLHAAGVTAQYIDNDEDGIADNNAIQQVLSNGQASLCIFGNPNSNEADNFFNSVSNFNWIGQDLYDDEIYTNSTFSSNDFDASIEECLHLVTNGYVQVYPSIWGTDTGTTVGNAMDLARGGQFLTIPNPYPSGAWYTYDDQTCDYNCMVFEYIYWGLTSILGGQSNRCSSISNEWDACTPALMQSMDPALNQMFIDSQYHWNTTSILPDGLYCPTNVSIEKMTEKDLKFFISNNILYINNPFSEPIRIFLFDISGKLMRKSQAEIGRSGLHINELAKGNYILKMISSKTQKAYKISY